MNTIKNAAAAILRAAKANPNITADSILQECIDGDIGGWLSLPEVSACNLSEWSAAMNIAAGTLDGVPTPAGKIIEVEVKSVYGNTLIFPANDAAKALARIAGKKTLSVADLQNAGALGLEVVEINRNYGPIANLVKAA